MPSVYEAVKNQDIVQLRECLKQGGAADDFKGALVNACEAGETEIVECFIEAGVFDSWAIVAAARFGHTALVERLLKLKGGDSDAALIAAAAHNNADTARVLIPAAPAALDEALADAALRGYFTVAKLLFDAGANPEKQVYGGQTAVELAQKNGHAGIVKLFCQKGKNNC